MAVTGQQLKQLANMAAAAVTSLESAVGDYVTANPGGTPTPEPARKPRQWGWRLGQFSMRSGRAGAYPFVNLALTTSYQQSMPMAQSNPITVDNNGELVSGDSASITINSATKEGLPPGYYKWFKTGTGNTPEDVEVVYMENPYTDWPDPSVWNYGFFKGSIGKLYLLPYGQNPNPSGPLLADTAKNRLRPAGILRVDEWLHTFRRGYVSGANVVKENENAGISYHRVLSPEMLTAVLDELGSDPDVWLPLHYQMTEADVRRYCEALRGRKCLVYLEPTHEPWTIQDVRNGWKAWQAQQLKVIATVAKPLLGDRAKLVASLSAPADAPEVKRLLDANSVGADYFSFAAYLESPEVQIASAAQLRAMGAAYFANTFASELSWNYKNRVQDMVSAVESCGSKPIIHSAGVLASTTGYNSADPSIQYFLQQRLASPEIGTVTSSMLDYLGTLGCPVVLSKDCEWGVAGHITQERQGFTPRMNAVLGRMRAAV